MRVLALILILISLLACERRQADDDTGVKAKPKEAAMTTKYPARCVAFRMMNDHVVAVANDRPALITLDPWPEMVFVASDGEHSIQEMVAAFSTGYDKGAPNELESTESTVIQVVTQLEKEGLVRISDKPVKLSVYLKSPLAGQDPEEVRKAMQADGFIKE
jgi:hypothetical protein